MEVDEAVGLASSFKSRQFINLLLIVASTTAVVGFHGLAVITVGWEPPHHCKPKDGFILNQSVPKELHHGTYSWSRCQMYLNSTLGNSTGKCTNGWQYHNSGYRTIVTEWNLVCDRNYLAELSQTIFQVGTMISALIMGQLSDRFGRKTMCIICHMFTAAISIGIAFIPSYVAFVILRFAVAISSAGAFQIGDVYVIETFDSTRRTVAYAIYNAVWPFTYWLFGLLGYLIREWRHLYLVFSLPSAITIVYCWAIPESLFWLCAKGRYEQAEKILNKMAKRKGVSKSIKLARPNCNGTESALNDDKANLVNTNSYKRSDVATSINLYPSSIGSKLHLSNTFAINMTTSQPMRKLFGDKYLRRHVFICSLCLFTSCLVYFGIALSTPTFAGNRHFNYFLLGIPEFAAKSLLLFMGGKFERKLERRKGACISYFITALCLGAVTFIPNKTASGTDLQPVIITIIVFAKFAVSCQFWIMGFYVSELLPTPLRSSGYGIVSFAGGLGGVVAPFGAYAAKMMPWVPNVLYSCFALSTCLLVIILPETLFRPLPQGIQDVHLWYHEGKNRTKTSRSNDTCESEEVCIEKVSTC